MPNIQEIPESLSEWERIAAHSHISGLGLEGLEPKEVGDGMIGQLEARKAAGLVVRLVKDGKFAGRAVLIAGPPGTGKTALAIGIAKELGRDVPFVPIAASEIFSAEIKKTEFLTQTLRKAIGVRVREMRKIYEGEVKELHVDKEPHPYNPYMQTPVRATMKLATKDESRRLTMDQSFALQLLQQGVEVGDIIQIDSDSGRIIKLGRSYEVAEKMPELSSVQVLPTPEGPVLKDKEFVYVLTLHQLDVAHSRSGTSVLSLLFGSRERKEIEPEVRRSVDELVREMVGERRAEIIPGVVFIDECSMLDIETFAFLNRAMEQELSPVIVFATNRGMAQIRGTDHVSPHALPLDLLDRMLIINTRPYTKDEIRKILEIRAKAEKVKLSGDALEYLTGIGEQASLRYAIQLIAPAFELAKEVKSEEIRREHVEEAERLFVDVQRSVRHLKEFEQRFLT